MNLSSVDAAQNQSTAEKENRNRSPLAQLVHALNQPLTGLQCAMEVALVHPRTVEQYVLGLREALVLTERMRALVEAIREVADIEETEAEAAEERSRDFGAGELENVLRKAAEDLGPVAAENNVRIALDFSAASSEFSPAVTRWQSWFAPLVFRLLDSALSLAAAGTVLNLGTRIETQMETGMEARMKERIRFSLQWQSALPRTESSRPELGLLIAQAGLERCGAEWRRQQTGDLTVLTVRWPGARPRCQAAGGSQ